jgi:hypothetical protein
MVITGSAAVRRLAVVLVALALGVAGLTLSGTTSATGGSFPAATPRATCGQGSAPETGLQGRASAGDHDSGRAAKGYRCNTRLVSRVPGTGGFKVLRYTDRKGRSCAYFDSTRFFPTDTVMQARNGFGVIVVDMTRPRHPVKTATLTTPAMLSPHESLLVNKKRGLLGAVMGNAFALPGTLDLYDLRSDCRKPRLLSSTQSALLGHESGWTKDGRTFWATGSGGQSLTAIDVSDPTAPEQVFETYNVNYHGLRLSNDGNTMYVANIGNDLSGGTLPGEGLRIIDVSDVQARAADPEIHVLSNLLWNPGSIPQVAQPFTRSGRHYLLEVDEFSRFGANDPRTAKVGAARIIDVENPKRPSVVSDLRLEVHQPAGREASYGDPGGQNPLGGYTAHYCSVPYPSNPRVVACSMINSGLRVFDISNLRKPREVAYFNAPTSSGSSVMAQPAWDVRRRTIWFTDTGQGFFAVRLTNGVGRLLRR